MFPKGGVIDELIIDAVDVPGDGRNRHSAHRTLRFFNASSKSYEVCVVAIRMSSKATKKLPPARRSRVVEAISRSRRLGELHRHSCPEGTDRNARNRTIVRKRC